MMGLCVAEKIGVIPWSPLARGRLARGWNETTRRWRSEPTANIPDTQEASDHAIVDTLVAASRDRGVSPAQIALAWLRHHPVVVAPVVGASKASHIDDAVASLNIELTDDEIDTLERPYTPRHDRQAFPTMPSSPASSLGSAVSQRARDQESADGAGRTQTGHLADLKG